MTDYYEDGDSGVNYGGQDDFYSGVDATSGPGQLEFQAFDAEETANVPAPNFSDIPIEEADTPVETVKPPVTTGTEKFWQIGYYHKYADVTTIDVGKRLALVFFPAKDFFQTIGTNPDLYGWFWVTTTLIFILAATGNMAIYVSLALDGNLDQWSYDFAKLSVGAACIYTFIVVCPLLVWVACNLWLELGPTVVGHFCIFGYSLAPYIPAAVIMIVPINPLRYAVILLACAWTITFLLRTYIPTLMSKKKEAAFIVASIVILNLIFVVFVYFYFYQFVASGDTSSDESSDESTESPLVTPTITVSPSPTLDSPSASVEVSPSASLSVTMEATLSVTPTTLPTPEVTPSE